MTGPTATLDLDIIRTAREMLVGLKAGLPVHTIDNRLYGVIGVLKAGANNTVIFAVIEVNDEGDMVGLLQFWEPNAMNLTLTLPGDVYGYPSSVVFQHNLELRHLVALTRVYAKMQRTLETDMTLAANNAVGMLAQHRFLTLEVVQRIVRSGDLRPGFASELENSGENFLIVLAYIVASYAAETA